MAKRSTVTVKGTKADLPEFNYFFLRETPVPEAVIEDYAHKMIEWIRDTPKAIKIEQFCELYGMHAKTLRRWRERSKLLDSVYEYVLMVLGNRREARAADGEIDRYVACFTLRNYCDTWKRIEEENWAAKKNEQSSGNITVVMQPTENSEMVKEKA